MRAASRSRQTARRASALPEVSIEEGIVERFGIDVGDVMRFDVLGRPIHARVSGIRRVEWREGRSGGFMFVFGAGTFEDAPHWFFAPVRANLAGRGAARQVSRTISSCGFRMSR